MRIRKATLDDTRAITALFCDRVPRWQRVDEQGSVQDLPYEDLTIYDRWLHGGAWMSIETGAVWLSHVLSGAATPFVHFEDDGTLTAYAEMYLSVEAEPIGAHLFISDLEAIAGTARDAMMEHALAFARQSGVTKASVSINAYDQERRSFYERFGFQEDRRVRQINIPAHGATVGFYKVTDHDNTDPAQITDWHMRIGRTHSARYHWEHLFPQLWAAIPQIVAQRTDRLHVSTGGQNAYVVVQQQQFRPRAADVFCWLPKKLSAQLIGSIRDWAYKAGYRTLSLVVAADNVENKVFGANV
ncbi:MAG: hypothetical protein AAF126_00640 [Chloroflexota bacterium]